MERLGPSQEQIMQPKPVETVQPRQETIVFDSLAQMEAFKIQVDARKSLRKIGGR